MYLLFGSILSVSFLVGASLFVIGDKIVTVVLGRDFGDSVAVFKAISITLIPLLPVVMLLGNILIYAGKERYYLRALILQGTLLVLTGPFFIRSYGAVGAVYAQAVGMFTCAALLGYYYFAVIWETGKYSEAGAREM